MNEPGTLCWNELNTRDVDGALAFYEQVFGLGAQRSEGYNELTLGDKVVGGCMPMPPMIPAEVPAHWLAYFAVDDIEASTAKAKSLGAMAMVEAMEAPDVGRFSVLGDPQGAVFAIIQLDNPM